MRRKSAILTILAIAAGALAVITSYSGNRGATPQQIKQLQEKGERQKLSFAELAQLAKAKGEKKVTAPGVATLYPTASTPEELNGSLPEYAVYIAEPVQDKSSLSSQSSSGGDSPSELIHSWYKFRILDVISQGQPHPSFAVRQIPEELLPVGENEVLVPKDGGTITVDGVEVTQNEENIAGFKRNGKYLLILSVNASTRVGELAFGPQSVLPLRGDGSLDPGQDQHMLQRVLKQFHKGAISQLKSAHGR